MASIGERSTLMSAFFGMAVLWSYSRYARQPNWTRYWLPLLAFSGSLLSEQTLWTLPFLLLLLEFWPLQRTRFTTRTAQTTEHVSESKSVNVRPSDSPSNAAGQPFSCG